MRKIIFIIGFFGFLLIASQAYALSPAMLGLLGSQCAGGILPSALGVVSASNLGFGYTEGDDLTLDEGTDGVVNVDTVVDYCDDSMCDNQVDCEEYICYSTWRLAGIGTVSIMTPGYDYEVSIKTTTGGTGAAGSIQIHSVVCP